MVLAKLDHVIWKINTYLSVIEEREVFEFVSHQNCRLGKWYLQGDGYENFNRLSSYRTLDGPHGEVHNATKKVFDGIKNLKANMPAVKLAIQEMENASNGVFSSLDQMLAEKRNQR